MPSTPAPTTRRRYLAAAGSVALASLAGCVGSLEELDGDLGDGDRVDDPTSDWPAPHFDAAGTSYNPAPIGPTDTPTERWRVETVRPTGRIAVVGETAYVPTAEALVARDVASGEERWRVGPRESDDRNYGRPWFTAPCVVGDAVLAGTLDGRGLLAVDAASGEERWRYAPGGRETDVYAPPVPLDEGRLVAYGDERGRVAGLDPATGEPAWTFEVFGRVTHLAFSLTTLYVGTYGGELYAVHRGRGLWRRRLPGAVQALAARGTGTVFVGTFGGGVFRLRGGAHAGRSAWRAADGPTAHRALALADGIVVGTDLARAKGLNYRTGETRWTVEGDFGAPPAAAGGTAYLGGEDGVVAVELDGGTGLGDLRFGARRFTYRVPGSVASGVTVADDALLFATTESEGAAPAVYAVE